MKIKFLNIGKNCESYQRVNQLESLISQLNQLIFDIREENSHLRNEFSRISEKQRISNELLQKQKEFIDENIQLQKSNEYIYSVVNS